MEYNYKEKKFVIVLSSNLEVGVAFNVVSHLSISAGNYAVNHMGREQLIDASGKYHMGISKYPVIITKIKPSKIKPYLEMAKENKELLVIDYPSNMYYTGHDDELADSIANTADDKMEYYGFMLFGKSEDVDAISGKFTLWK